MWNEWLDMMLRWVETTRTQLAALGETGFSMRVSHTRLVPCSRIYTHAHTHTQAVITSDGEKAQVDSVLQPEHIAKANAHNCEFFKYPSACSLLFQPNDRAETHKKIHAKAPFVKVNGGRAKLLADFFRTQGKGVWPADTMRFAKIGVLAKLFAGVVLTLPEATSSDVIRLGWQRAGWDCDTGALNFPKMVSMCLFDKKDLDAMAVWERMAVLLTPTFAKHGGLTEVQIDALEAEKATHSTLTRKEKADRAKYGTKERDQLCLIQRRALHLTTPESIAAREVEAQQLKDYLEEQALMVSSTNTRHAPLV